MSPDILLKIENILNDSKLLDAKKIEKFIELLGFYSKGKWIYPGVVKRNLKINMTDAYKVLDVLKKHKILEVNYEIYCHGCDKFNGEIYQTFSDISPDMACEDCGSKLSALENSIVIYRVIDDGEK